MEKSQSKTTIKKPYLPKDEMTDKELWSGAFNAVAGALGVKEPSIACNWADLALRYWRV